MTATFMLGAILGITLRQARRLRRALARPEAGCDISWCVCDLGDNPAPCPSHITYGGVKGCTLTAHHHGLHEHGGWRWTDSLAEDAA